MGSPDPYGRQLNGIGSGVSSTSKIVILGRSSHPDADVDYTFVQVGIREGALDMAGNCGNMSSIVGPAAWDHGFVDVDAADVEPDGDGGFWTTLRIFNTNTSKILSSRFRVAGSPPRYCPDGDHTMDGVPGTNSKITLSFMDPAGAKTGRVLPTGNAIDNLELRDGSTVKASLVDAGNPGVFVSTQSLGLGLDEAARAALTPQTVETNAQLKVRLEQIRRAGASKMGLDPDVESVPKIVLLFPESGAPDVDIRCLAMSMGQAHRAVPLTLALCLGVACRLPNTIASKVVGEIASSTVTIGHPSGKVDVGTTLRADGSVESAELLRTARVMMKGDVFY